jgi:serine phosphatase RsbU (regulator of sigma subunit)
MSDAGFANAGEFQIEWDAYVRRLWGTRAVLLMRGLAAAGVVFGLLAFMGTFPGRSGVVSGALTAIIAGAYAAYTFIVASKFKNAKGKKRPAPSSGSGLTHALPRVLPHVAVLLPLLAEILAAKAVGSTTLVPAATLASFALLGAVAIMPWAWIHAAISSAGFAALLFLGHALDLHAHPGEGFAGEALWAAAVVALVVIAMLIRVPWQSAVFKADFLAARHADTERELSDAREMHEALFPQQRTKGALRFSYRYEPMRQIGGDYFFVMEPLPPSERPVSTPGGGLENRLAPREGPMSLIVLDVTGHGITAAMAVSRLSGELNRIFQANPEAGAGETLKALNKYVFENLAKYQIFVTALVAKFDPVARTVEYANGGHPPVLILAAGKEIREVDSTALLLGVLPDRDFDSGALTLPFEPGDCFLAYTDGAMEAKGTNNKMFGIEGLKGVFANNAYSGVWWPGAMLTAVMQHRQGQPALDDTLFVEVAYSQAPSGKPSTVKGVLPKAEPTPAAQPEPVAAPVDVPPAQPDASAASVSAEQSELSDDLRQALSMFDDKPKG